MNSKRVMKQMSQSCGEGSIGLVGPGVGKGKQKGLRRSDAKENVFQTASREGNGRAVLPRVCGKVNEEELSSHGVSSGAREGRWMRKFERGGRASKWTL